MPINGLPMTLETMLNVLISDNEFTSWQIRSGMEYTQVTLRFSLNPKEVKTDTVECYKRVSKAQLTRGRARAAHWRENKHFNDENLAEQDITQMENTQVNMCLVESQVNQQLPEQYSHVPCQGDQHETVSLLPNQGTPTNPLLPTVGNTELAATAEASIEGDGILALDVNNDIGVNNVGDESIASEFSNHSDEWDYSSESSEEVDTCGECDNPIKVRNGGHFYRCSECTDLSICKECYFDDQHNIHQDQIHAFNWIPGTGEVTCDVCGEPLGDDPEYTIWQCTKCEDYGLCLMCKNMDMHRKHKQYLKEKLLTEFKKLV